MVFESNVAIQRDIAAYVDQVELALDAVVFKTGITQKISENIEDPRFIFIQSDVINVLYKVTERDGQFVSRGLFHDGTPVARTREKYK